MEIGARGRSNDSAIVRHFTSAGDRFVFYSQTTLLTPPVNPARVPAVFLSLTARRDPSGHLSPRSVRAGYLAMGISCNVLRKQF